MQVFKVTLLLLLLCLASSQFSSDLMSFRNNITVRSVTLPHIEGALLFYCLNSLDFKKPFSLTITNNFTQSEVYDVLKLSISLPTVNSVTSLEIRYLVTVPIRGWQLYVINLTSEVVQSNINAGRNQNVNRFSIPTVKRGYFVTGFSNSSLVSTISLLDYSPTSYAIKFIPESDDDWVELVFVRMDLTPGVGCPTNDMMEGTVAANKNRAGVSSWNVTSANGFKVMTGLSDIVSSKGTFLWNEGVSSAQAFSSGSFKYLVMQVDTACNVDNDNYIPQNIHLVPITTKI